ncbi:MAG: hypothetical protein AAF762_05250 [Pseudomonadota bacterium]
MFEESGQAFVDREYEKVIENMQVPTVIFAVGRILRVSTAERLVDVVSEYREKLSDEGVFRLERRLVNRTEDASGAEICVLENAYYAYDDSFLGTSVGKHWCRETSLGTVIELTEYLKLPLGLDADDFGFLRTAA